MQTAELPTFQNVSIEYVLPTVFDRCMAYFIDIFILGTFSGLSSMAALFIFGNGNEWVIYLIIAPIFFFYSLLFEIFNQGQSAGKKVLNLRVIRADGTMPRLNDFYNGQCSYSCYLIIIT
jgi:uncharacterized RDD family membrane protein YckC